MHDTRPPTWLGVGRARTWWRCASPMRRGLRNCMWHASRHVVYCKLHPYIRPCGPLKSADHARHLARLGDPPGLGFGRLPRCIDIVSQHMHAPRSEDALIWVCSPSRRRPTLQALDQPIPSPLLANHSVPRRSATKDEGVTRPNREDLDQVATIPHLDPGW